ncbi:hypothetical protein OE09_2474 [Flavobacteriaceae bacterium MAR_2010_72]|nr:hypothetical protein OE09_2474 [Flavobacteriaceae bacterium MAR_2010_72]TVZ58823.1 hypothetical protein NA63_1331 [Flavobacteriaceae bacterium MAR_2010_105]
MKKILIILLALVTLQVTAQEKKKELRKEIRKERMESMQDLTPEEIATLQTKKMTLNYDLNESQQKQIMALNLEEAKLRTVKMEERKAMKANAEKTMPTKEDKLKMANERLDHQIALKAKMKTILNQEQFEKWEANQAKMQHRREGKMKMARKKMAKENNKQ